MKFRLLAEALADIKGTADYYQQYDNKLAKAFVEETYSAIKLAVNMPKIGVKIHRNTRRILLKRFPYAVIYLPLHNKIVVIAVMHQRRRPDYWKTRISSQ